MPGVQIGSHTTTDKTCSFPSLLQLMGHSQERGHPQRFTKNICFGSNKKISNITQLIQADL